MLNKRYCVSVKYKDGSTALLGPFGSRSEARAAAGRNSGDGRSALVAPWSGPPSNGSGVLRPRTPPPFQPTPEPPAPLIEVVWDENTNELTITADQPIFAGYDTEGWLDVVGTATNAAVGASDKYVDDYTLVWTDPVLNQPTTISEITFSRGASYPSRVTEHVWTGSVDVTASPDIEVVYNSGTDELTITTSVYDFTDCSSFNFTGTLSTGQLQNPTHFVPTETEIVVAQASFYMDGGTISELMFFGPSPEFTVIATWTGSVDLF